MHGLRNISTNYEQIHVGATSKIAIVETKGTVNTNIRKARHLSAAEIKIMKLIYLRSNYNVKQGQGNYNPESRV